MRIELLGFVGCPNTPALRKNLIAALARLGALTFADVEQTALADCDPRRGWPAPSVLIDGQDLFGMPPARMMAGCRLYPGGVPDPDELVARLAPLATDLGSNGAASRER